MTDYEKKLFDLKNVNAEVDAFESADNHLVIQHFINDYVLIEFIYTMQGNFIEKHEISAYPTP